jgi:serine/threonine-protein kinase
MMAALDKLEHDWRTRRDQACLLAASESAAVSVSHSVPVRLRIEPVFDRRQTALWSSDRRSFAAAWFVSTEMGFVAWQDFSAGCYVRAVCSDS